MSSQIPHTPLTPGAMERLTLDERMAFEAATCAVAGDQKPSLEVVATLVLTVQRLISEPDALPLPSAGALRAYMTATGWREPDHGGGPGGKIWSKGGVSFGVPHDDDAVVLRGAIERLAATEGRKPADVARGIISVYGATGSTLNLPASGDTGRDLPAAPEQARDRAGADLREPLGRIVREAWVTWALEQPDVADHPFWTVPWDELAGRDREVDMRIGHAVADYALTENAITWGTDCTSCAGVLDSAYAETVKREAAEAKLAAIEALCRGDRNDPCWPHMVEGILAIIDGEGASHG